MDSGTPEMELLAVHQERYCLAVTLVLGDLVQGAPLSCCLHNASAQAAAWTRSAPDFSMAPAIYGAAFEKGPLGAGSLWDGDG